MKLDKRSLRASAVGHLIGGLVGFMICAAWLWPPNSWGEGLGLAVIALAGAEVGNVLAARMTRGKSRSS